MATRARLARRMIVQEELREDVHEQLQEVQEVDEEIEEVEEIDEDNIPRCGCCEALWSVVNGRIQMPGCGCAINGFCPRCGHCLLHCSHQR